MSEKKIYGTSRGHVIDDDVIEALAAEAEAGYDTSKLRRRGGRQLMGSAPAEVKRESVTASELAKHRDSSAEAHRLCWLDLLRPFDNFHPGAAEAIYLDQPNPAGWHPFDDTLEVLKTLSDRDIPIGVVSDIGWDLRPVFGHFGADRFVTTWVLSYEHGTEKPDPHLFELGCEGLGTPPSRTLMVGDSVEKDAGAARAGLTALTLPSHSGSGERGLRGALKLVGI